MLKLLTVYLTVVFYLLKLINIYCHVLQWLSRDMASTDINEIKIIIRGLLVSSPQEINVAKLRQDFRAQEGRDIPFYEYGYHDITSFLRSIPDVCQISHNENGPYAIVRPVESDKSAHVSSLVMRQKNTVSKGRKRHSAFAVRGRYFHTQHKTSAVSHSYRTVKKVTYKPLHSELASKDHFQTSCIIPSLEEPLVCNKTPSKVPEYDTSYSLPNDLINVQETWPCGNQEKNELTCEKKYSYVPDTSENEYTQLPAFVDFHLRQLLTENKCVHLNEVAEHIKDSLFMYGIDCSKNPDSVAQILRTIPSIKIENEHVYLLHSTYEEQSCEEMVGDVEAENISLNADNIIENDNRKEDNKGDLRATADIFVPSGKNEKVQRLEKNLFSLMKDHSSGILGSELKEKYKMKFAAPLNLQILGCNTVWNLSSNLPHIFNSIFLEDGNFMLFPASLSNEQLCKVSKPTLSDSKKKYFIPAITKRNVQWLMEGYSNGLISYDFEKIYQDTFLGDIELTEMGFSSIEEFLNNLEDQGILRIIRSETANWLLPSPDSGNFVVDDLPLPQLENMETEMDIRALKEKFPSDVVGPDTHVEQVEISPNYTRGSYVEVFVQEVNNPHHFWITFYEYSPALNTLMDDLQAFYCTKSHSYRMAPELIREGQDCVTQYVDEWHRARITRVINATEVEVCFYDYGTRSVVRKDNVHYLLNSHSDLPAQAVRAALANIAPVEDMWTQEASKRFLQLIADKGLFAIIKTVDRVNKVFSLFLCDTRNKEDVYIHEVLVEEGYAVRILSETSEKQLNNGVNEEVESTKSLQCVLEDPELLNTNATVNSTETCIAEDKMHKYTASRSNSVQEIVPQNSKTSPLPCKLRNSQITCTSSIATPPSVCASSSSSSSSNSCVSVVSKVTSTSSSSSPVQQVAPPPGFCNVLKCELEASDCDKIVSPAFKSNSLSNLNTQVEEAIELPKQCSDNMDEIHELPSGKSTGVPTYQNVDHNQSVNSVGRSVNSGVNANFPQEVKSPYISNANTYPSWAPTQTYSQFPGFTPSFPPMNFNTAVAPMPLTPFSLPPLPPPLDFYSLLCYEQYRQQLILQGVLAHQQMAASVLPTLPPGLYLPHSQPPLSAQMYPSLSNPMNISEVHSPESSRPGSASCQMEITAANKQIEDATSSSSSTNQSSSTAVSAADASAHTTHDILSAKCLSNDDSNKRRETLQTSEVCSETLPQDAAKMGDTSLYEGKDTNDVGIDICNLSSALSHTSHSLDNISINNIRTTSISLTSTSSELENSPPLGTESYGLQPSSAVQFNVEMHQSRTKIKGEKRLKEGILERTQKLESHNTVPVDNLCDLEVKRSNKQIVESEHFVSEICKENINGVRYDEEFEENIMVLNNVNEQEQNNFEKNKPREAVNDSVNIVDGSFMKRSKELEFGLQDMDPIVLIPFIGDKEDKEISEDICGVQTCELIGKEQEFPETVLVSGTVTKSSKQFSGSSLVHKWTKTFAEESRNVITESANEIQFSTSEIHSERPIEVQKNSEIGEKDMNVKVDELEVLKNLSLQDEKSVTVPQLLTNNSRASLSYIGSDHQERHNVFSASETLCSDFKTLNVSKWDPSNEILPHNKQKNAKALLTVNKTCLQTTSDVAESSVNIYINGHNRCKDLFSFSEHVPCTDHDRITVPQPSYSVQEKEDRENEFAMNSWTYNNQNTVTSRKGDMTSDKAQSISLVCSASCKKGRPVLGAKLSSEVSEPVASVLPPTSVQKPLATLSDKLGAKLKSEVLIPMVSASVTVQKTLVTSSGNPLQKMDNLLMYDSLAPSCKTTWCSEEKGRCIPKDIGHECTKTLPCGSGHRNLSKQTNAVWHKESHQSTKHATSQQFVKKIHICDKKIHLINLDGRPYVPTDEIVNYFTPFNGRHVILKILEARKVEINFLEFSRRRRPEFFECLDKSDIDCLSRGPTGNVIGSVHIVPLRSVPYMLRALNKDDVSLSMEVKNEMEKFDPNDSYWFGHSD